MHDDTLATKATAAAGGMIGAPAGTAGISTGGTAKGDATTLEDCVATDRYGRRYKMA